ncbi:hypothetical protein BKN38_05295 [Helicobacter sp. CLO-3]|uniref:AbrB/MazE/SpoVT family DNA-binding domain-containing protein n=1 Tax=unclassified Helicobacter TaxID=2593540 RepID=UPI000805339F|nr:MULTISPECIES: AbrB/MazE/SpoVT family DNA-binding domain-containing protein [unclassified Helicobacter]OBV30155.1 hypothetical protein BA723_02510 [Helicobacter sp. CLO-3]OHU83538.1 hypothetical protein BKN38_05295 [Helicobacter sp. CLO-3]
MQVTLNKWGNSVGLRIPNNVLQELRLDSNSSVDVRVENGKAIIEPLSNKDKKLHALLNAITDENLHGEISCGVAVGKENV